MFQYQPDWGFASAAGALWRYRHWPAQRTALRAILAEWRRVRARQRDDERSAALDRTLLLIELDSLSE